MCMPAEIFWLLKTILKTAFKYTPLPAQDYTILFL